MPEIRKVLSEGGFDLVIGNPPFNSCFRRVESKDVLSHYELGRNRRHLKKSQAIEVLFLEIFVRIVRDKGFVVIVLPDGILSDPQYQYVREFILKNARVLHIISLQRNVFAQTSAKTSILILEKQKGLSLNYFTELHDLGKGGKANNTVRVLAKGLIKRMDYRYYHYLRKNALQELVDDVTPENYTIAN